MGHCPDSFPREARCAVRRKNGVVAIIYLASTMLLFMNGGTLLSMAQDSSSFTVEKAIVVARGNAKPDSSFKVLRKIFANADTRRIGYQALQEAKERNIELYEDELLTNILKSGAFLLLETNQRTNNVIALHIVSLEPSGSPKDFWLECPGILKLADAEKLSEDTTEIVEQLYAAPSTEGSSLGKRFYDGSFPKSDLSMFAYPNSLRKLGANPNEVQEAAALYGGYMFWGWRYALSMPAFAASPIAALSAAGDVQKALTAKFLQTNHMNPDVHLGLDNVHSKKQLQERIALLTRLNTFLEDALKNQSDPTIVKANLSLVTIPLGMGFDPRQDEGPYSSSTPSMLLFFWERLTTGGFAVKTITGG
jgi:hypothetical protein